MVDTGALSWAAMHIRRPDVAAIGELAGGALWAVPAIVATIPIAAILLAIFPVTPISPLPPAGEATGFAFNLLAGAVVAPIGEEIMFRGFATTAWAADVGRYVPKWLNSHVQRKEDNLPDASAAPVAVG